MFHHVCRHCRRVCFHLLDRPDGVKQRICLGCWDKCTDPRLVPKWYYHFSCNFCRRRVSHDERRNAPAKKSEETT
jgi:hypothetical protein